jgi:hypothetical protein
LVTLFAVEVAASIKVTDAVWRVAVWRVRAVWDFQLASGRKAYAPLLRLSFS